MKTKGQFYKLDSSSRIATAERFAGERVRLTVSPFRDSRTEEYDGILLAGAWLSHGTTSDVVVIRTDAAGQALAFSGAQVVSIETRAARR